MVAAQATDAVAELGSTEICVEQVGRHTGMASSMELCCTRSRPPIRCAQLCKRGGCGSMCDCLSASVGSLEGTPEGKRWRSDRLQGAE